LQPAVSCHPGSSNPKDEQALVFREWQPAGNHLQKQDAELVHDACLLISAAVSQCCLIFVVLPKLDVRDVASVVLGWGSWLMCFKQYAIPMMRFTYRYQIENRFSSVLQKTTKNKKIGRFFDKKSISKFEKKNQKPSGFSDLLISFQSVFYLKFKLWMKNGL
jgi:hypothetical protein